MKSNVICIQEKRIDNIELDVARNTQHLIDIKESLTKIEENQNSFVKWLITILATVILSLVF